MGCQLLLHEATGLLILATLPLNFPMLHFVVANEKCTGKSVIFCPGACLYWEISTYSLKCIKYDNEFYLKGLRQNFTLTKQVLSEANRNDYALS